MKTTELMMLAPFVLNMSDIEYIVNTVNLEGVGVDKEELQGDLAHLFLSFSRILSHEKKRQDELERMISLVGALRQNANSIIDTLTRHGYPMVASLQYAAKKYLLKNERDPSLMAQIHFDPRAGDELVRQKLLHVDDFVAFVNSAFLEIAKEHGLLIKKITSETHISLFRGELRKVYNKHFPTGSRLRFDAISGKHFGPYLRFCVAVADKYSIENRDGRKYAEGSIVEFIRGRPPRSRRRSRGQSRAVQAEPDTG